MGSKFDRIKDYITGFKAERATLKAEIDGLNTSLDSANNHLISFQNTVEGRDDTIAGLRNKLGERDTQLDELVALTEDEAQQPETEEASADRIRQEEEVGEAMYEKGVVSLTPPTKKAAAKKTKQGK